MSESVSYDPPTEIEHTGITKLKRRLWEDDRPLYMIAAAARVSPSRLSDYANAVRDIPARRIIDLCAALECNPDDIIGYE